jgi:PAS domain S-box-containing protein
LLRRKLTVENAISKRVLQMGHEPTCEELVNRVNVLERQLFTCRRAEEALQESEQRYRSLVETMNDGLLVRDESDAISYVNERLTQMVGYSRDEMVGNPLARFLDEANQAFYELQLAKRRRGECDPYELTWTKKCGCKIATIMSPKPLFDAHGQVNGSFAVITDITSRKEAEDRLLRAWAELEEKVKERTAELARANSQLQDEIAERNRAEDALRREHSFRTAIIERAAEGLCVCHKTREFPYLRFTIWNERMAEITGYARDEINELGWHQGLYPDPKAQEQALLRMTRMRAGEDLIGEEWEITRADGEKRVVSISTSILQTDEGVIHALALVHDVTRQKLAEEELSKYRSHLELLVAERTGELTKTNGLLQLEAGERRRANESLRKANQRLQDIIDFLPDATFVIDREKKVMAWNRAIEQMTGISKKDILGQGDYAYSVPFYGERRPLLIDLVMSGAAGVEQKYDFVERTERDVWGEVFVPGTYEGKGAYLWGKASPLFDKKGNLTGAIQSIRDISDRKKAEKEVGNYRDHLEELVKERTIELARANERLKVEIEERRQAEEVLKLFAYSVAHDLKSPAIGIYGLTKRLCEHYGDVLDERGANYCDQILRASEHIAALVERINVYIATKEARPLIETTNIQEILRMLKDEFLAQLSTRRIEWFEPDSEIEIRADRLSLVRIFRNLIDNALKYGGEQLSKISIGYEEAEPFHIFSVTDNGQGLRGDNPEKIFGLFQRHETSRGVEGAGLGLAIVKEIAEQHGGRVWIESATDDVTSFCISISKSL